MSRSALAPTDAPRTTTELDRADVERVVSRGDEAGFRSLYQRHAPALYAFALRLMGGNASEADDVMQDAWLRAVRSLGSFGWRSSLRTWLSTIVLNCCRERWRERAADEPPAEDIPALAGDLHLSVDLEAAVASLPPGYRAVLVLHDIEGYTHDEIGDRLGIESGTSKSQLFHARRAVRAFLGGRTGVKSKGATA